MESLLKSAVRNRIAWILLAGVVFVSERGHAEELPELASNSLMRSETRWVVQCIEQVHYSKQGLNDRDMGAFLEAYIESLDFHHLHFLRSEVDRYLKRFEAPMVRYLHAGNLFPAFEIYRDFRSRVIARSEWVDNYLMGELDFSGSETYETDRSEIGWPESSEEMEHLWHLRIRSEVLNEVLALMTKRQEDAAEETAAEGDVPASDATEAVSEQPLTYDEALAKAKEEIRDRYRRWSDMIAEYESTDVQEIFLGELAREFDPHSSFLSSDMFEEFSISMQNSLVGIGAVLESEDGVCRIRELIPGGPADLSGEIGPGDEIRGVAQGIDGEMQDILNLRLRKIVKKIRGEEGTIVRLEIRPAEGDASEREEVRLIRDRVKLTANLAHAEIFSLPAAVAGVDDNTAVLAKETEIPIGVIYLPSFYGSDGADVSTSASDVAQLVRQLKDRGVEGLILDLRRNGGGLLGEAVRLTGLFIPDGPVVQVRDTLGQVSHHDDEDDSMIWDGPLMVLVSRYSASASEIVAGALKAHRRAIVVGDRTTHGKGTVQAIFQMNTPILSVVSGHIGGAAKVTVQKFYLPDGASTQNRGVESDIVIPSINEYLPIGESDLDNALLWDEIGPTEWDRTWGPVADSIAVDSDLLGELRRRSEARRERLPEFDSLGETITFLREQRDRTEQLLNLETRLKLRQERVALQEQIDERWEELAERVFEGEVLRLGDASDEEGPSLFEAPEAIEDKGVDVPLREGLRIMVDWIQLRSGEETAEDARAADDVVEPAGTLAGTG